jgi:ABC-2 type transport system permease protein
MLGMYGSFSLMNNPEGPMEFLVVYYSVYFSCCHDCQNSFGVPAWQIALSIVLLLEQLFYDIPGEKSTVGF